MRILILLILAAFMLPGATISWKGYTWNIQGPGSAVVNVNGSLTLSQNSGSSAEVDLVLNQGFNFSLFSYLDNPTTNIDMFQQNTVHALNPRTQNGSAFVCCSLIGYERYSNSPAIETVVFADLTPRVAGTPHTVSTFLNPDGSINHTYDTTAATGTFLKNNVGSFGGWDQTLLRLRSRTVDFTGNSVTFTDFQAGANNPAVPEPSTYALLSTGLVALIALRKKKT